MGTQVTNGADTDRLRQVAEGLSVSARRVLEVEQEGATSIGTLIESWAGPDTQVFAADWQSAGPQLVAAAELLSALARQLVEQAEQQDDGSDGSGRGGGPVPSTPGSRTGDPMKDLAGLVPRLFDVKNGDGRYLPDMTAAAGPRFGPQDPAFRYLFDRGTDWANDVYTDHVRDRTDIPKYEWALKESSDWLRDVKDEYLKKKTNPFPFDGPSILLDVVADTLEDYGKILHDPKGWWDNDATTWDKVSIGISLVPYLGVLGKVAVKTTKEAFDVVAKGFKHADDVKTPHAPKKSTVDPGSGPDAHDTGNPNKGSGVDGHGPKSDHDGSRQDGHDSGNPNRDDGPYHGKHIRPDPVPNAPATSLPPGQHVDFDRLPDYHVKDEPLPTQGPEGRVYDPDFDRYAGMTKQEFYDKWYDPETKNWRYPSKENGAPYDEGFAEPPRVNTLQKDQVIDRLGTDDGNFAAPIGTSFDQRALPSSDIGREYHRYRVLKPLPETVTEGRIQPWFDQPGGAMQYKFDRDIKWYVDNEYLEDLDAPK